MSGMGAYVRDMWLTAVDSEVAARRERLLRSARPRRPGHGRHRVSARLRLGLWLVRLGLAVADPVTSDAVTQLRL
jgi:hypothetical protein